MIMRLHRGVKKMTAKWKMINNALKNDIECELRCYKKHSENDCKMNYDPEKW